MTSDEIAVSIEKRLVAVREEIELLERALVALRQEAPKPRRRAGQARVPARRPPGPRNPLAAALGRELDAGLSTRG